MFYVYTVVLRLSSKVTDENNSIFSVIQTQQHAINQSISVYDKTQADNWRRNTVNMKMMSSCTKLTSGPDLICVLT